MSFILILIEDTDDWKNIYAMIILVTTTPINTIFLKACLFINKSKSKNLLSQLSILLAYLW